MKTINSFQQAQQALRPFYDTSRTPYTLDTMRSLMAVLGNPQDSLKVLHIAGTSGKTSTAYYCAALLRATGASVGLTVSPHVDQINERLQINLQPLPEAAFGKLLAEFLEIVSGSGLKPSYFELLVAMAFWEFNRQKLDYAVIEVGLGGLLDATNVISRADKVCLITDIGLDHTEILGHSLPEIAAQKAGIVQSDNQVFMYHQSSEIDNVVSAKAQEKSAALAFLTDQDYVQDASLPLFQQRNLGLAKKAVNFVLRRDDWQPLTNTQLKVAVQTLIPARLERFHIGATTIIIDGSHNAQKTQALVDSLRVLYPKQRMAGLVAFVKGDASRWQGAIDVLLPITESLIVTSFRSDQDVPKTAVDPEIVASYCRQKGYQQVRVQADPATAFQDLQTTNRSLLLVTGSFYLLNHIRPLVKVDD